MVDVLTRTSDWFEARGIPSPRLQAERILSHVLGMPRLQLYLVHDRPLTASEQDRLRALVVRRGDREPLAWVLGEEAFHDIELNITPDVLVPRPDTETLVNAALEWLPESSDPTYLADVGCGSGAVGLALASARTNLRVYAIDREAGPLACTKKNVQKLSLADRVAVLHGDLLAPVPAERPIDWVVSNPPYIPSKDIDTLEPEVSKWEPRAALDGGLDGLEVYRRLVPQAAERVTSGLLVEVGIHQHEPVAGLFEASGLVDIRTWTDLGGVVRVVGGRKP